VERRAYWGLLPLFRNKRRRTIRRQCSTEENNGTVENQSREALHQIARGEEIVFIDTRNEIAWAESDQKLPGAKRIPADEIELHSICCREINAL